MQASDGTGTSTTLTGLEGGRGYDVQVKAKNHEGESPWSISSSAKTQDKNVNSEFKLPSAKRSVAENSSSGRNVGAPVTATDTENHTLTYSISGASEFTIDSATGQIKVASGADLDYEDKSTYSVTVSASDGKDSEDNPDDAVDATINVTISITDVNEPPAAPNAPTVAQGSTPTTTLDVSWVAPETQDRPDVTDYDVQYKKTSDTSWTPYVPYVGSSTSVTLSGLDSGTEYEAAGPRHQRRGLQRVVEQRDGQHQVRVHRQHQGHPQHRRELGGGQQRRRSGHRDRKRPDLLAERDGRGHVHHRLLHRADTGWDGHDLELRGDDVLQRHRDRRQRQHRHHRGDH